MKVNDYLWAVAHDIAVYYDYKLVLPTDGTELDLSASEQIVNHIS